MAYLILGKKVRAMAEIGKVASLGDLSDLRYNNNRVIKITMSLTLFLGCVAYLAAQIKAGSELFGHLLGWDPLVAGFVIFGVLAVYMSISGEVGGLLTQAFQGLVMVIAGVVIVVSFFNITGGFGEVLKVTSQAGAVTANEITKEFSPDMLNAWGSMPRTVAMTWMLIPILGTVGQPQVITRMYALKDPRDMPKMGLYTALSHTMVGLLTMVVSSGALYLVATGKIDPLVKGDRAIYAMADYAGITAQLFVYAGVLAAAMSSASLFLSICSTVVSRDIPSALGFKFEPKKQVQISRISMLVLGIISIVFSVTQGEMVGILGTFGWGTLMSATFPVFVLGLLWKRANEKGVMCGSVTGLALNIASFAGFKWPGVLPWYFNVITISIAVTVAVSLITKEQGLSRKLQAVIDL
ncbi:Osmoregulated proline transporter OpuE [bioreactor metagenome]|uniref:Osmoregulated proline transporter OpuE n=2 Tax=root TaxID=1 RepID=A0A645CYB5_9ZZZZ